MQTVFFAASVNEEDEADISRSWANTLRVVRRRRDMANKRVNYVSEVNFCILRHICNSESNLQRPRGDLCRVAVSSTHLPPPSSDVPARFHVNSLPLPAKSGAGFCILFAKRLNKNRLANQEGRRSRQCRGRKRSLKVRREEHGEGGRKRKEGGYSTISLRMHVCVRV